MKKKHPTVDEKSVIDSRATAMVRDWLADGWIVRQQTPDYYVDYIIELVKAGEPSGAKFCVQQKGHREVHFSGPFAREQMKAKHLLYYSEKERLPVFLFVINTTERRGYYLFMQEWLDLHVPAEALWRRCEDGGKWSVEVPQANNIENAAALAEEVERAFAYMKRKHPGRVEDAIARDIDAMSAIDPRFGFSLNVVDGKRHYVIKPKQDVDMSLQVTGADTGNFAEFFDYGKPLEVSGDGVRIFGSPLFENRQIASLRIRSNATDAQLYFWTDGPDGFRQSLPVTVSRGKAGRLLTAHLDAAPFRAEIKVPKAASGQVADTGTLKVSWPFEKWSGVDSAKLPYFDFMLSFSMAILANKTIKHELVSKGNRVTSGTFGTPGDEAPFMHAALVVDHARKLREISAKTGMPIIFPPPDLLNWCAFSAAEITHALVTDGQYEGGASNFSMDAVIEAPADLDMTPEIFLRELERAATEIGHDFEIQDRETVIHGTRIALGTVVYSISPARITVHESSRSEFLASKSRSISVKISAVESSMLRVRVLERRRNP